MGNLSIRFNATLIADVPEDPDNSDTIKDALRRTQSSVYRLVYEDDEKAADVRRLLDASLEQRIKTVDQICRLTDPQKRKLRLAGRGDIKHFFERVEVLRPKDGQPEQPVALCGNADGSRTRVRPQPDQSLFAHGSIFSKTLKSALTAAQAVEYEATASRRQDGGTVQKPSTSDTHSPN